MLRIFSYYVQERFNIIVTLPIIIILILGGRGNFITSPLDFSALISLIFSWSFLLCTRVIDDISDLSIDVIKSPHRLLVKNPLAPKKVLVASLSILLSSLLLHFLILNYSSIIWIFFLVISLLTIIYSKKHLPFFMHTFAVNAVFPLIVIITQYCKLPSSTQIEPKLLPALFIYFGTIAHDYAHSSVDSPAEKAGQVEGFVSFYGQKNTLRLGIIFYIITLIIGIKIGLNNYLFLSSILIGGLFLGGLFLQILRTHNYSYAKHFYIWGFAYLLVPFFLLTL